MTSRLKYRHSSTGAACFWWLRSVRAATATGFCYVNADGGAGSSTAYYARGFAPGFKAA